jgi:UDP-N-acetylmuramoyl-tripeptide--D-alanyl-D-alanine ligase
MDPHTLSQIAIWSEAQLLRGDPSAMVQRFSKDSRTLQQGDLYISLKGERFNGDDFIAQAAARGAIGALYDGDLLEKSALEYPQQHLATLPPSFGMLHVKNAHRALQQLAAAWRRELSLRVVMITGSNGKTTTKDFTTALLRRDRRVIATEGNYNNSIGLPLSMLRASRRDEVAVWEIGMNHRGEIAPLAALGKPDIAIITNIGTAHIGFLGSREAIAEEKGDLLPVLSANGLAILPAADHFCEKLAKRTQAQVMRVGLECGDLQARALVNTGSGSRFEVHYQGASYPAFLPVIGTHMVNNALMALAAAMASGIPLEEGIRALAEVHSSKSRLALSEYHGIQLIDDSYNANPDSVEAALTTIASFPCDGRRIAVLGRMGELGSYAEEGYRRVGRAAAALDLLITVDPETSVMAQAAREAGAKQVHEVANNREASQLLLSFVKPHDLILVKGSLSTRLKEVVSDFIKQYS